jgi:prepilin-type N-terminal cleavage/methylation domain-containing protein
MLLIHAMRSKTISGFTLIEMSIVLLIIGLIIGTILVADELIEAAYLRQTVAQIEKFDAAAVTFRIKYNGLPGDLSTAGSFGFSATNQAKTLGRGNDNGLIESTLGCDGCLVNGEPYLFWTHLAQAGLIPSMPNEVTDYNYYNTAPIPGFTPSAAIGKGNIFFASSFQRKNYFAIGALNGSVGTPTITPLEAYQIDSKLDDGEPDTGKVISIGTSVTQDSYAGVVGGNAADNSACYNTSTTPPTYSITASPQTGQCFLSIRTNF